MFDPLFPFVEPIMEPMEDDLFHFIAQVETLEQFIAEYDSVDTALSSKVREVIEQHWSKHVADLQDLSVGQFHERLAGEDGQVSYRPTNRYVLRVKFYHARESQQTTFSLAG